MSARLSIAAILCLISTYPAQAAEPFDRGPVALIPQRTFPAAELRLTNPALALEGPAGSGTNSESGHGWPLPLTLLVAEATIVGMSSSGYIAEALEEPPNKGAMVVGATLMGVGGTVIMFYPMAAGTASDQNQTNSAHLWAISGLAVGAAGAYDYFYLYKNHDPTSAQVFRDNMIALNAAPLVVWAVSRRFHWKWHW